MLAVPLRNDRKLWCSPSTGYLEAELHKWKGWTQGLSVDWWRSSVLKKRGWEGLEKTEEKSQQEVSQ